MKSVLSFAFCFGVSLLLCMFFVLLGVYVFGIGYPSPWEWMLFICFVYDAVERAAFRYARRLREEYGE